jgi:SAM-dependent methyltransferase
MDNFEAVYDIANTQLRGLKLNSRRCKTDDDLFGPFVQGVWPAYDDLRVNDYDPIADVFDRIMADDFHSATYEIRRKVALSLERKGPLRCLDLCCGTGLFFSLLAADLPIVGYGLDCSKREVDIAQKRRIASGGRIDFRVEDIVATDYPPSIDFVTINFDALNHVRGSSLWQQILQKSLRSLVDGGILLFDINLPERLARDWNCPEIIIKDDLCYIQHGFKPQFRALTITRRIGMIVFSKLVDGRFARSTALIEQFAMPAQDVLDLAKSAGFRHAEVIVATGEDPVGHIFNKNRAFILARK